MWSRIASLPPTSPIVLSCLTSRLKPCPRLYLAFWMRFRETIDYELTVGRPDRGLSTVASHRPYFSLSIWLLNILNEGNCLLLLTVNIKLLLALLLELLTECCWLLPLQSKPQQTNCAALRILMDDVKAIFIMAHAVGCGSWRHNVTSLKFSAIYFVHLLYILTKFGWKMFSRFLIRSFQKRYTNFSDTLYYPDIGQCNWNNINYTDSSLRELNTQYTVLLILIKKCTFCNSVVQG